MLLLSKQYVVPRVMSGEQSNEDILEPYMKVAIAPLEAMEDSPLNVRMLVPLGISVTEISLSLAIVEFI